MVTVAAAWHRPTPILCPILATPPLPSLPNLTTLTRRAHEVDYFWITITHFCVKVYMANRQTMRLYSKTAWPVRGEVWMGKVYQRWRIVWKNLRLNESSAWQDICKLLFQSGRAKKRKKFHTATLIFIQRGLWLCESWARPNAGLTQKYSPSLRLATLLVAWAYPLLSHYPYRIWNIG